MLTTHCLSTLGQSHVERISFLTDFSSIQYKISIVDEFRRMLLDADEFPAQDYYDLRAELMRLKLEGTFLEVDVLSLLRVSLKTIFGCIDQIGSLEPRDYPLLHKLLENVRVDVQIVPMINRILNDQNEIKDDASPTLLKIRKDIASAKTQVDKKLAQTLAYVKAQKWIADDAEISVRNGRLTIPFPASNKRKIKGYVHDESATGQTVYIEPGEVLEINNEIRELESAEKREITRILLQFCDYLRPQIHSLLPAYEFLGHIDFLRANVKFSETIGAVKPVLTQNQSFEWYDARHPLLFLSLQKQYKPIVPLDISLTASNRILIISGPNAGGKSVCLKTVGLLQYMLQCGLPVPMRETSETGIFEHLFMDIGDSQSIENDLSTYSSHLLNLKNLMDFANSKTLFLIDEFGAGTEPQSGGAIAESVLEKLNEKTAFGVVTTHYANLKTLARKENGIANAAMLFDTRVMKPLFRLSIGNPGSSFAFELASNIDFPKEILAKAGEKVGSAKLDFDRQLQQLEAERVELNLKEKQLRQAESLLSELMGKYEILKTDLETRKKEILAKARTEAVNILEQSNKIIENTVREIRHTQAEKEKTQLLRAQVQEQLEKEKQALSQELERPLAVPEKPVEKPAQKKKSQKLEVGAFVKLQGQTETGQIEKISGAQAEITFKGIKMRVKLSQLELSEEPEKTYAKRTEDYTHRNIINDINARMANFRVTIDVRHQKAQEALITIEKYVDEAILLHVPEVSILHGKGNGVLRKVIRDYLKTVPEVKSMKDDILERGGSGITVVNFRG